jgi:hypothetical protein
MRTCAGKKGNPKNIYDEQPVEVDVRDASTDASNYVLAHEWSRDQPQRQQVGYLEAVPHSNEYEVGEDDYRRKPQLD